MSTASSQPSKSHSFLKLSANIWFALVVLGQFIFALYIMGMYGVNGLAGDFEKWNVASPQGYIPKDLMGNVLFGAHVLLAAVITLGGPLQIMRKVRDRFPRFHRINGRVYIFSAFLITVAGLYLTWVRGNVGGQIGSVFITTNGSLILICAVFTIRKAVTRQLAAHRKWAVRLYMAMSGVWFFRVLLMLWLTIFQAPVGFDPDTFQGPALNMLSTFSYVLPLLFLEVYFRVRQVETPLAKWAFALLVLILAGCMAIGTLSATMGMWLPSL